ncbi:glycosyl hydrolases family 2, sugar binding domain [Terrimicrobium sacchariphilum]|uniref:Glycosyl hydrolases family 2, sugar binding domain n=2 Tax=Terrimicrobium sacchariphilum TaxID=690879 RepID=A0A146G5H3_TERSA|nr:glycosyl hydrolases family 2, sugar binding domain [Terrimicrobium sacchariphilum]
MLLSTVIGETFEPSSFAQPPARSRVETWWHWMDGRISKDGLSLDLDSMKMQGIQRATITLVGFGAGADSPIALGTPEFFDVIRFTANEAKMRGITLGLTAGPGWSGAGGPWIPVEQSMKRVVFSSVTVDGDREVTVQLPALPANAGWARDTYVLAWPDHRTPSRMSLSPRVLNNGRSEDTNALCDANPSTSIASAASADSKTWSVSIPFSTGHRAERAFIWLQSSIWMKSQPLTLGIRADGHLVAEKEMSVSQLEEPITITFPRVTAQTFEVEVRLPDNASFNASQFSLREAEFLEAEESPQWDSAFRDLGSQISDSAGPLSILATASLTPTAGDIPADKVVNLTALRTGDIVTWKVPPGRWRIVRYGYTTTNQKINPAPPGGAGYESDKMSAAATELQYRSYITPILEAAGSGNRSTFTLLTADSWESGMQNWCADFPEQFRRRRGYDIVPWMPALTGATVNSTQETLRFFNDFRETISDLVIENYYEKLCQLAHADGLAFAAEFAFAGPRLDAFRMTRAIDVPMEELWSDWKDGKPPTIPDGTITQTVFASAAQVCGKRIFGYELFTSLRGDWRRTPGDFSFVGDLAFLKGMNQASLHSMMHQPDERQPGLTLQGFGQHFQRHNTWWTLARDWLSELARKQYIFQNSSSFHDILIYYGDTLPRSELNLSKFVLPENVQPLFIDHDTLINRISVKDGMLRLDNAGTFACLILPGSTMFSSGSALRVDTLQCLSKLVDAGATLIGEPPLRTPGLLNFREEDALLKALVAHLWNNLPDNTLDPHRVGKGFVYRTDNVAQVLANAGYLPTLRSNSSEGGRNVKFCHILSEDKEAYFLFNPNEGPASFVCDVADLKKRMPERWDPANGSIAPLPVFRHRAGRTIFPVDIPAKSSVFIVLQTVAAPRWVSTHPSESSFTGLAGIAFRERSPTRWTATSTQSKEVSLTCPEGAVITLNFPSPRTLPVNTPWRLQFRQLAGQPEITMTEPVSWTSLSDDRFRNYSGLVVYETSLNVPPDFLRDAGNVILDIGHVGRACRVSINGRNAGTLWRQPWQISVDRLVNPGENSISIEVVNTWYNRLMADQSLPARERTTWTSWPRIKDWLAENAEPEQSGLLGPVKLVAYPEIELPATR